MRTLLRWSFRLAVLLLALVGVHHVLLFHVGPWWMARQEMSRVPAATFSAGALYEADNVLDIDIRSKDPRLMWDVGCYMSNGDRPVEEVMLVPNEGGLDVHSLYLMDAKKRHRVTVRGVKVRFPRPPAQHFAAR